MKTILITGTPGVGKSFLAEKLSFLLSCPVVDAQKELKKHSLLTEYDSERQCFVVDDDSYELFERIKQHYIAKGEHYLLLDSHFLSASLADIVIVVSCPLPVLQERLRTRGYLPDKVRENLDAEIFEVCLSDAKEQGIEPLRFDSSIVGDSPILALEEKIKQL